MNAPRSAFARNVDIITAVHMACRPPGASAHPWKKLAFIGLRFGRSVLNWGVASGLLVGLLGVLMVGLLGVLWAWMDPAVPNLLKDYKEFLPFLLPRCSLCLERLTCSSHAGSLTARYWQTSAA
jgi:hypothetical protein